MGGGQRDKGGGELCGRKRARDYGRAASKGNANEKKGEEENDKGGKKRWEGGQTVVTHFLKSCCLSLEMTELFFFCLNFVPFVLKMYLITEQKKNRL